MTPDPSPSLGPELLLAAAARRADRHPPAGSAHPFPAMCEQVRGSMVWTRSSFRVRWPRRHHWPETLDLRVDDAVVIHNSNKLALRLLPCDVFARVALVGQEVCRA